MPKKCDTCKWDNVCCCDRPADKKTEEVANWVCSSGDMDSRMIPIHPSCDCPGWEEK